MDAKAFIRAVDAIVQEKNIARDVVFEAMELALQSAYKRNFNSQTNVRVDINRTSGNIRVLSFLTVVDEITDENTEILLKDAKKIVPTIQVGETIEEEVTPKDFGRVAAFTAKQVVVQKIREAERDSILTEYGDKQDELLMGVVTREDQLNYYIDLGRAQGMLPKTELIGDEELVLTSTVKVYLTKVEVTPKGPKILLSRKHYGFVKRLLESHIPELKDGIVVLYGVAREAGVRSKVAVYSENSKVDPIGSCIGENGTRISQVIKELKGEKIDVILYDKDPIKFIENALSPAKNIKVFITNPDKKEALVVADGDNLSLAIGKKGLNVRLASRLTHYKIEVKTSEQLKETRQEF